MEKSSLKTIVEHRSSEYNAISFKTMDFEDYTALMISAEDGGGSVSFIFEDAHELITFAKRVAAAAEKFLDE